MKYCVTQTLVEMKNKSRISYVLPGLAEMISKSRFNHDVSLHQVVCVVKHRKCNLQNMLFDMKNQISQ